MRVRIPPMALWAGLTAVILLALVAGERRPRAKSLPEETLFIAALRRSVSTADARPGDDVELWTVHAVRLRDGHVVPAGAVIYGHVLHTRSGRGRRAPELLLRFTAIDVAGDRYEIAPATFHVCGRQRPGAVPGVAGGSAGVATESGRAIDSDGRELTLPAGRRLGVRLSAPVAARRRPSRLAD